MSRTLALGLAAIAGLAAGLCGYAAYLLLQRPAAAPAPAAMSEPALPERLPAFTLDDLDGRARSSGEWDGRVIILNFWATWCAPCRKEVPHLVELQRVHGPAGLQVVGVAIDQPDAVRSFAEEYAMDYPLLIGGEDGIALAGALGNAIGALPYTVIADRQGRPVYSKRGVLELAEAERVLAPLL